ncbi:MAG: hypothetical protein M3310_04950 [Actinomycetota bacterium]|nr:hypothetical protein [Actinomycetota bacterium]
MSADLLDRIDRHLVRNEALMDRLDRTLDRSTEAFDRSTEAFERNQRAFEQTLSDFREFVQDERLRVDKVLAPQLEATRSLVVAVDEVRVALGQLRDRIQEGFDDVSDNLDSFDVGLEKVLSRLPAD